MALSGVRRLAMSKMVAKEKKPVKAVFGLFARILGRRKKNTSLS
jgi:hypothetical protein